MGPARQQAHSCIEHGHSARCREYRVEVNLGELRKVARHPGQPQQQLFEAFEVDRPRTVRTEQERSTARRRDQVVHVVIGERGEAREGGPPGRAKPRLGEVGQHLGGGAAEAEQHERAEYLVLDDAREQLGAAVGERLQHRAREQAGKPGLQVPEGGAYLGVAAQVEMDGVFGGLVQQPGPVALRLTPKNLSRRFSGDISSYNPCS